MVAEPVQATLQTLNYYYLKTSNFIATQHDKVQNSDYIETLKDLYPFNKDNGNYQVQKQSDPLIARILNHMQGHKVEYISALSIGIGINAYIFYNRAGANNGKSLGAKPKRRVPKLPNGARKDVVLVVGSPTEPLTRLIALDFEKRGFIVYLTILDQKDSKYIESNPVTDDINYLNFAKTYSYEVQLMKFQNLLDTPVTPFPGAKPHTLCLKAVVFTPNLYFPIGPVENISIASWDRINERFSVYVKIFSSGLVNLLRSQQTKTILMTTNIISALDLPYHAPETIFQNSLRHLFTSLSRELKSQNLSVTQVRLGNLNVANNQNSGAKIATIVNSEIRTWDEDMKQIYGENFERAERKTGPLKGVSKGTSLRELYHTLFDAIYDKKNKSRVVYCGSGARAYDRIARYIPDSIIEVFLG